MTHRERGEKRVVWRHGKFRKLGGLGFLRENQGLGQLENKVSLSLSWSSWRRDREKGESVRAESQKAQNSLS